MRIRGVAVPIAMVAVLVIVGGATAGLLAAKDQAPRTSTPEAAISTTDSPLKAATPWDQRQQAATYTSHLMREVTGQGTVATRERDAETARGLPGADKHVEKNSANTAGNGAPVNRANGGNIAKPAQHSQDAGPVSRSETGGSPEAPPGAGADRDDQVSSLPEKDQLKYPKLGSRLNNLVVRVEAGEFSAQEAADGAMVQLEGSVAVTVYLSGKVADVVDFLEDNGGDPRNVGEDYIEAYVPVSVLGDLSEQPGVLRVREVIPPQPDQ